MTHTGAEYTVAGVFRGRQENALNFCPEYPEEGAGLMDFAKFGKVPVTKEKKEKKETPAKFIGFFEECAKQKIRVDYAGVGHIGSSIGLCGTNEIGRPSSFRIVNLLPQNLQPLVCKKDGSYGKDTKEKWGNNIPEDLEKMGVLQGEKALEAFNQYGKDDDDDDNRDEDEEEGEGEEGDDDGDKGDDDGDDDQD